MQKSDTVMFVGSLMQNAKKMHAELHELRYFLEQNVERRTEHLQQRIDLLESCNATLCSKLASAQEELAALRLTLQTAEQIAPALKLYDFYPKLNGPVEQEPWDKHATAA